MRNRINWVLQRPILAELKDKYFRVKKALETPNLILSYGIREVKRGPRAHSRVGAQGGLHFIPCSLRRVNSLTFLTVTNEAPCHYLHKNISRMRFHSLELRDENREIMSHV